MDAPKRKLTAKAEPSSHPTSRAVSRSASPIVTLDDLPLPSPSPSPSPLPASRPKAKVTATSTVGSSKSSKPAASPAPSGRKTPVWNMSSRARERPTSLITPRSPAPPKRGASPTRTRLASPEPSSKSRIVRKPPTPPSVLSPPAPSKRAVSPARRRNPSPARPPPTQTLPRRTTSPTRPSVFGQTRHRRVASASSSVVSRAEATPSSGDVAKTRLKLPSSLSAITLNRPPTFSSIPPSPPRSPYLASPSPAFPSDSSINLALDSAPQEVESAPPSAIPHGLLAAQDTNRVVASAPVTPTHVKAVDPEFPRPRVSSGTITPVEEPDRPVIIPLQEDTPQDNPPVVKDSPPTIKGSPPSLRESLPIPKDTPLAAIKDSPPVVRIKAKITHVIPPSTSTPPKQPPPARPQTLAAPRARSSSISANSALSGVATSTLSRNSSVRVTSASRILSPPHVLGIGLPGFSFPAPSAIRSPPASILSSSSSTSHGSDSSRTASSTHSTHIGRPIRAKLNYEHFEAETPDRDDSGIDMFEEDGGEREEARSNRKIADLEISNKSLLAINATLESTKARQAKEIRDLRRRLRESRLILPPPAFDALERSDPLDTSFDDTDSESEGEDVTQLQADETFARVRNLLDQLMVSAKEALESQPVLPPLSERERERERDGKRTIRVLDVHEINRWRDLDRDDVSTIKSTTGDVSTIPGTPTTETEPEEEDNEEDEDEEVVTTPPASSSTFGLGLFNRWTSR